ncbi:MAG: MFS transporter [Bacteroidetes bacterium]|nr:MFS transporter [Bacteroidota bacterium]
MKDNIFTKSYSGISRNMWLLASAMLINRSGSMVLVFMSVYLTKYKHFSIPQAGIVMAMFGIGSLVGAFIGGKLVDKIGFYPILIWSLILSGLMLICLGHMQSFPLVAFFTFLVTAMGDAFRPANTASIASYTSKENYPRSIALNRLAMNLGFTIGPLIGGLLATYNYKLLFWADGLTCMAAGLFIYFVLPKPKKVEHTKEEAIAHQAKIDSKQFSPYKDKAYLWFVFFTCLYATSFFQIFSSLPLYYKDVYHLSEKHIGWLLAFNGMGVAVIEMVLIYYIQHRWTQFKFISLGVGLLIMAYLMLVPLHSIYILIGSMMIMTVSEMLAMPFMSTYAMNKSPKVSMGQYMALYSMSWSLAQILAPIVSTRVIEHFGYEILWITLSGIAMISFIGFRWLEGYENSQESTN